jgi:hypothetical protein
VDGIERKLAPKLMELAFILMARRGSFIPLPDIIEFLWENPDDEPECAEDVVRCYAYRLRRILPKGSLFSRAGLCTDKMEPGFYIHGALMLERESYLPQLGKRLRVTSPRKAGVCDMTYGLAA